MNIEWPNKEHDLEIASKIIEEYIEQTDGGQLGLFELVISHKKEASDLRISGWVIAIAEYFRSEYGLEHGNFVTKMIISKCLTNGNTLH